MNTDLKAENTESWDQTDSAYGLGEQQFKVNLIQEQRRSQMAWKSKKMNMTHFEEILNNKAFRKSSNLVGSHQKKISEQQNQEYVNKISIEEKMKRNRIMASSMHSIS